MTLYFSKSPGCWERHVQRQANNPLFDHTAAVTQADIDAAQRRDEGERVAFAQTFAGLLEEVTQLKPREEGKLMLDLKDRIDRLYEDCANLGGEMRPQKQALQQLSNLIMQAIRGSGEHDPQALAEFEKEAQARTLHYALLEHPIIAHLLRPDTPITQADLIPSLLSEDEPGLRAAMSLFDLAHQQIICEAAEQWLLRLRKQGRDVTSGQQRLAIMLQPLQQPH